MNDIRPGCLTLLGIALVLIGVMALDSGNRFFGSAAIAVGGILLIAAWRAA